MAVHTDSNINTISDNLQAINQQLTGLEFQIQNLKRQLDSCQNLGTSYEPMKAEEEATRKKCSSLQKEVTDIFNRVQANSSNELSSNDVDCHRHILLQKLEENDTLRRNIQELHKEVWKEKALHKMDGAMRVSEEAMSRHNGALQNELQALHRQHENVKTWGDLCRRRLDRIDVLRRENKKVQGQIINVDKKIQIKSALKDKYQALEAEEQVLQARNDVLNEIHSEISRQLCEEEHLRYKYDVLKERTNNLWEKHNRATREIQIFNENIGNLSALKGNHELLKAEKRMLNAKNKKLQSRIEQLQKKLSKQQALEEKNNVMKAENEALSEKTSALKYKVQELRNAPKDGNSLPIISDFLKQEKHLISWLNYALHKELQRLTKKLDKEKALERKRTEMRANMEEASETVQLELQDLHNENINVTTVDDLSGHTLDHIHILKRENNNLKEQIQVINRQLQVRKSCKDEYEQMETQKKALKEQNQILIKTLSETYRKLLNEEDWKSKHDVLKEQTDALNQQNEKLTQKLQVFNKDLGNLSAFKADYKSLAAENMILFSQNGTLDQVVEQLKMELTTEEEMENGYNVAMAENEALSQETSALKLKVNELRNTLKGEKALALINDSLKVEKDIISCQNVALHKELQKLTKKTGQRESSGGTATKT